MIFPIFEGILFVSKFSLKMRIQQVYSDFVVVILLLGLNFLSFMFLVVFYIPTNGIQKLKFNVPSIPI